MSRIAISTPGRSWAGLGALALLSAITTCGPSGDATEDGAAQGAATLPSETAQIPPDQEVRTADPYARGYTDDDFPRVQELAPGVFSYEQLRTAGEERFTTVSMFVVTGDGVLVADGQGSVEETRRLVQTIGGITDQPIRHVVIASDHGDHTAGNTAFPTDAAFYAHPTSEQNLARSAAQPNRPSDAPPVVMPTVLVEDRLELDLGEKQIEILFLGRAHTGGDLVVYLPEEKVLFMSEAYLHRVFPAMRSAYPTEWVAMLERAQAMDVDTYVPGHGFVDASPVLEAELEVYRQAVEQVVAEATRLHGMGLTLEEALEQVDFGVLETWSLRDSQGA
ncbi:MAG: MBL fold metallo-hydrolase, partial [Gemmatimonadetes bacterium]|nr:MBL fold metallo-hydrolase [Gemmatimonadota bacterium]